MLDFYSRYALLGELGCFLLDRLDSDPESPFQFKHEYYIQTLNDFNLADLLYAIEKKRWCLDSVPARDFRGADGDSLFSSGNPGQCRKRPGIADVL